MPDNSCEQLLKFNGLSLEILEQLSFQSNMGMSLKKDLRYFDKQALKMLVLRYKKCYLCTKKTKNNTIYEENY